MPQDVNIRTAGTVIGSALYDDRLPLVQPRNFAKVAPHDKRPCTRLLMFHPADSAH